MRRQLIPGLFYPFCFKKKKKSGLGTRLIVVRTVWCELPAWVTTTHPDCFVVYLHLPHFSPHKKEVIIFYLMHPFFLCMGTSVNNWNWYNRLTSSICFPKHRLILTITDNKTLVVTPLKSIPVLWYSVICTDAFTSSQSSNWYFCDSLFAHQYQTGSCSSLVMMPTYKEHPFFVYAASKNILHKL